MTHVDWEPEPKLDCKCDRDVWDHTAPHSINTGQVDGNVEFSDEVLEGFRDEDE